MTYTLSISPMLHKVCLLLFLCLAFPALAQSQATVAPVLWREPVVLAETNDPYEIVLLDGRRFEVRLDASGGAFPENWQRGSERLTLEYDEIHGAAAVHCVTGLRFSLVGWEERSHPIDLVAKRDFEADETTLGIVNAYADASRRWQAEILRVYGELQRHPASSSHARKQANEVMRAWRAFQKTDDLLFQNLTAEQDGTKWRVMAAEYEADRNRWHARRLMGLWGSLRLSEVTSKSREYVGRIGFRGRNPARR